MRTGVRKIHGYRGIWFDLGQKSEFGSKYSGGLGTYTAKHCPLAVYAPAVQKTFFVYGGTTEKDQRHLLAMASYYDHKTKQVPKPVVVHDKQGVDDPHDNPSVQIDEEGHLWVYVSGRGTKRPGHVYRSQIPYDIESFEHVSEREFTYPQPWWLDKQGFVFLFTKYTGVRELYWRVSDAHGENWTEDRKLAGMGGHYQDITTSTHNYDMGSLYVEPGGKWRVIAPTESGPQEHGTGGEIAIWVSQDKGVTWEQQRTLTKGSPLNHGYVRRPRHAHPDFYGFWADGNPDEISESRLYFTNQSGAQVFRLPYDMESDPATPEHLDENK